MVRNSKKVIIIGSGIGGLTAGNILVRKGYKVTVFESHSRPGGYVGGFYKQGFYFESGTLGFMKSNILIRTMKVLGVLDKISLCRLKVRLVAPEFDFTCEDFNDLKEKLANSYKRDSDKLKRFFSRTEERIKNNDNTEEIISDYVQRFFARGTRIYNVLTNIGFFKTSISAFYYLGERLFNRYYSVYDGMQSVSGALTDNLKNLGGEIRFNSYVGEIVTKEGRAEGVISNRKLFRADYVISDSDYRLTFFKLLKDSSKISSRFKNKVYNSMASEAFFTVYLGINVDNKILREYMRTPCVMWFGNNLAPDLCDYSTEDKDLFKKNRLLLYSPSLVNQNLAPKGKSSLMIICIFPPGWMNDWFSEDRNRYKELKEKVKVELIKRAENIIPNLRKMIEFEDSSTPVTCQRYTHNYKGASSAWAWYSKDKVFLKDYLFYVDTPFRGLYVCSDWANNKGGVDNAIKAGFLSASRVCSSG